MATGASQIFVEQVREALEILGVGSVGEYALVSMSGVQVTDLLAGDHVELDTINDQSGAFLLSTGAGQANGLITVPAGKVWILSAAWQIGYTGISGFLNLRWRNNTDAVLIGVAVNVNPETQTSDNAGLRSTVAIIDATLEAKEVEVRIVGNLNANRIEGGSSRALIRQV